MAIRSNRIDYMLKIGVTGGIGSGKTHICKLLETAGYPVFYADDESKKIVNNDRAVKAAIVELLGEEAYLENSINTSFVGKRIFTDEKLRKQVNEIIHPVVLQAFFDWSIQFSNMKAVFIEAAILIESGFHKKVDKILFVKATQDLRIKRAMERDNASKETIVQRLGAQIPEALKYKMADYVIDTEDNSKVNKQIFDFIAKVEAT